MKTIWHMEVVERSTGRVDMSVEGGKEKVNRVWKEVKNLFPRDQYKTRIWTTREGEK